MRKVVIHRPGGYERLVLEEHPDPAPKEGEILIRTEAAGVNYADCVVRWGFYESARQYVGFPITPGFEYAGEVAAVGSGVEDLPVGSKVFGVARFGAYATQLVVPRNQVFPLPEAFEAPQAAGFPAVFLTAYHALYQNLRLRPGMKLLVHSAAGGVGTALLQLGKLAGCEMIAVVGGEHKEEVAREFGADAVIVKSREKLWKAAEKHAPDGYDVVLDGNGASTLKGSYRHLAPMGKLVSYGFHSMFPMNRGRVNYLKLAIDYFKTPRFNPIKMHNENRSVLTFNLSFLFDKSELLAEAMHEMLGWIAQGKLKPPKVTCFPLAEVAKAHQTIESGQSVGKLILLTR